jgi:hypothetical protein
VTNNILTIAQQKLLYARNPEMKMSAPAPAPAPAPKPDPAPAPKPSLAKPGDGPRKGGGRKPKTR